MKNMKKTSLIKKNMLLKHLLCIFFTMLQTQVLHFFVHQHYIQTLSQSLIDIVYWPIELLIICFYLIVSQTYPNRNYCSICIWYSTGILKSISFAFYTDMLLCIGNFLEKIRDYILLTLVYGLYDDWILGVLPLIFHVASIGGLHVSQIMDRTPEI